MDTWDPYQALYLHIPFCKKRCNYCDFATQAISCNDSRLDSFTDDLIREIRNYSQKELLGEIKTRGFLQFYTHCLSLCILRPKLSVLLKQILKV